MRHRKKLALFLALCVGAGSLVITTGEEKPVPGGRGSSGRAGGRVAHLAGHTGFLE